MKKNGLGKGLSSLIPNYETSNNKSHVNNNVNNTINTTRNSNPLSNLGNNISKNTDNGFINIDIDLINVNVEQPRKYFDEDEIISLAESIKMYGVLQPLIVTEINNQYVITAGERRYRAAKYLNLKTLPCVIISKTKEELLEISLIENIQREDLNPIEEANAFKHLIDNFDLTQDDLSKKLSLSRTVITNKLRLLKLSKIVQNYILNREISEGHGKIIAGIKDEDLQVEICDKIIEQELSVRQTEKLIKLINEQSDKPQMPKADKYTPHLKNLKTRLENHFGTKVSINDKNNKGNIKIEYYSNEDLNRILSLIYQDKDYN